MASKPSSRHARLRRSLAVGLLAYVSAYAIGRRVGWLVFHSMASHPAGTRTLVPPRAEGEAWSAIQRDNPRDLYLSTRAGGRHWPSLVFGLAGWMELRLAPSRELERRQRIVDSRYLATLRVLVAGASGPGELVIRRDGFEFRSSPLVAGLWSEPIEVPSDETLLVQWSRAGSALEASVVVPKGRHEDLRLTMQD